MQGGDGCGRWFSRFLVPVVEALASALDHAEILSAGPLDDCRRFPQANTIGQFLAGEGESI